MVGVSVILFSVVVHAQQSAKRDLPQSPTEGPPTQTPQVDTSTRRIEALRVTEAIKIDGLLNESAWSSVQPASDFVQEEPFTRILIERKIDYLNAEYRLQTFL